MEGGIQTKLTFYTVADRSQPDQQLQRHSTLAAALDAYRSLPDTGVRTLGATLEDCDIDLVQCRPLQPADAHGEDILVADYQKLHQWRDNPEVQTAVTALKQFLKITRMLSERRIIDLPAGNEMSPYSEDKFLWPKTPGEPASAVERVLVAGQGWLTFTQYHWLFRQVDTAATPYVKRYSINYMTLSGETGTADVSPKIYDRMLERTKDRLREMEAQKARSRRVSFPER